MPNEDEDKRKEAVRFLTAIKECILSSQEFHLVNRYENKKAIRELGLTNKLVVEEIITLSIENYCSGPEPDQDPSGGFVLVFGKEISGTEVYIKLKLYTIGGVDYAKCISFHPAERPLSYPFT